MLHSNLSTRRGGGSESRARVHSEVRKNRGRSWRFQPRRCDDEYARRGALV